MSGILDSLKDCSDSILGIREKIGADIHKVYIVTRTWTGEAVGAGECSEVCEKIEPTPAVKDLSNDHRVKEGGAVQNGDLQIRHISKNRYSSRSDIDCTAGDLIEKFYKIGEKLYTVINVTEDYITWHVQVRMRSDQRSVEELNG
jgi:hypothetical protein